MTKRQRMTAAELMAALQSDPVFQARKEEQERSRRRMEAFWQHAETPIVEGLRAIGLKVDSVWDLVNTSVPYPEAIPVLLAHLQREYPDRVREGVARALAVP